MTGGTTSSRYTLCTSAGDVVTSPAFMASLSLGAGQRMTDPEAVGTLSLGTTPFSSDGSTSDMMYFIPGVIISSERCTARQSRTPIWDAKNALACPSRSSGRARGFTSDTGVDATSSTAWEAFTFFPAVGRAEASFLDRYRACRRAYCIGSASAITPCSMRVLQLSS